MVISADIKARDELGLIATERSAIQETAQSFGAILVLAHADERMQEILASPETTPARTGLTVPAADQDAGTRRIQHFVVDRGVVPEAFSGSQSSEADSAWQRLLASHGAETSQELNERHAKGLTPYSVDLKPKSETFGVLMDRGKLVHAGLALRDVIAVPIHIRDEGSDWEPGIVTVSASREDVAGTLGARLNVRIETRDSEAETADEAVAATAFTPALLSSDGSSSILEVALASWNELRDLRSLVRRFRTVREDLAEGTGRLSTMGELSKVALVSGTGMISP